MLIQGDTEAGEKSIDQPKKTVPKAVKKTGRNRWNATRKCRVVRR